MIKGVFAIAATLSLAAFLPMPGAAAAKGFGPHLSHLGLFAYSPLGHHRFANRHRQFDDLLAGYGYVTPGSYIENGSDGLPVLRLIATSPAARCSHSRETVKVSSEDGGTRDITITRC